VADSSPQGRWSRDYPTLPHCDQCASSNQPSWRTTISPEFCLLLLPLLFRSQQNRLLLRAFNLNTVSFNIRIIFEGLMNDAPIESAQRLQFNHVPPSADFFRGFLRFLHQGVSGLGAVAAHIHHHFWRRRVLLEEEAIGDVLE